MYKPRAFDVALHSQRRREHTGNILHVTRDQLSLIQGVTWIDVDEIMRTTNHRPAALSLLDGELLEDLDGIDPAFDMWLTAERERLRDRARSMAEALLREQTDPGTVISAARRLLQIDRAHEEVWRALMRAHAGQGERGRHEGAAERPQAAEGPSGGRDAHLQVLARGQPGHAQTVVDSEAEEVAGRARSRGSEDRDEFQRARPEKVPVVAR